MSRAAGISCIKLGQSLAVDSTSGVSGRVPENQIFRYLESAENGIIGQVEQDFSSFFAKFLPYLRIFHSIIVASARSTLKNHQIRKIFGKI